MTKHDAPAMDPVSAHLDRGWDLFQKNDLTHAEHSARQALELEKDCPEAHALLGAVAAAAGEDAEALDHFRRAIAADPEYVSPLLYAAEVLLGSEEQDDHEEALRMIQEAVELAEEEDEWLDAILLQAEALLALGRHDEAEEAMDELPEVEFPEGSHHLRAGRTYLDLGHLDAAEKHVQAAIQLDPEDAEAWHTLGFVLEERGEAARMVEAWKKTRELDLKEADVPWTMTQEAFEEAAEAAMAELPKKVQKLLENVPVMASDYPAAEIVTEGFDPRLLGFFSGVPYPDKSNVAGGAPHLDCVFLYKKNIERACRSQAEVVKEIRTTVLHETGHFFGLDEEELEEMGLG